MVLMELPNLLQVFSWVEIRWLNGLMSVKTKYVLNQWESFKSILLPVDVGEVILEEPTLLEVRNAGLHPLFFPLICHRAEGIQTN